MPRAPRQPVTHDAAGASVVLPATLMNAEEVSPQPVTYGPPALGVADMFGQRAAPSTPSATLRSGATRHVTSQPVDTAATPRHSFFKMFDSRSPAGSFHRTNMAAPSTADMYGTQICPSPMQPSPENLNEAGLYNPPAHRCFTQKYPTQKESFPGVWPALRRWTGTCSAIEYLAGF